MVQGRRKRAWEAWSTGSRVFQNEGISKKMRIQIFQGTIRPIIQYGLSTQKISNVHIEQLQFTISKMIRMITEKKRQKKWKQYHQGEKYRTRTNQEIRKKYRIPTMQSQLERERINFLIRAKMTASPTYLTGKEEAEKAIETTRKKLFELQKEIRKYKGKRLKEEAGDIDEGEKEKIRQQIKGQREDREEKMNKRKEISHIPIFEKINIMKNEAIGSAIPQPTKKEKTEKGREK